MKKERKAVGPEIATMIDILNAMNKVSYNWQVGERVLLYVCAKIIPQPRIQTFCSRLIALAGI